MSTEGNIVPPVAPQSNIVSFAAAVQQGSSQSTQWIPLKPHHRRITTSFGCYAVALPAITPQMVQVPFAAFRAAERYTDGASLFANSNGLFRWKMLCSAEIHVLSDLPRLPIVILKSVTSQIIKGPVVSRIKIHPFDREEQRLDNIDIPALHPYVATQTHIVVPFGSLDGITTTDEAMNNWLKYQKDLLTNGTTKYPPRKFYYDAPILLPKNTISGGTIIPLVHIATKCNYRATAKCTKETLIATAKHLLALSEISAVHINSSSSIRFIFATAPTWPLINSISELTKAQIVLDDRIPTDSDATSNGASSEATSNGRSPWYVLTDVYGSTIPPAVVEIIATHLQLEPVSKCKWSTLVRFVLRPKPGAPFPTTLTCISGRYMLTALDAFKMSEPLPDS